MLIDEKKKKTTSARFLKDYISFTFYFHALDFNFLIKTNICLNLNSTEL